MILPRSTGFLDKEHVAMNLEAYIKAQHLNPIYEDFLDLLSSPELSVSGCFLPASPRSIQNQRESLKESLSRFFPDVPSL